jgi:hypothetical protein
MLVAFRSSTIQVLALIMLPLGCRGSIQLSQHLGNRSNNAKEESGHST